jgi:murein DD-endopeptidase MepM/ murein hydrolase activator NlpD
VLALLAMVAAAATFATPPAERPAPTHWDWPAQGTITTPFGVGGHPGIDIGILRSLRVRAAAPGRVRLVGEQTGYEGYGKIVLVDVGGGYQNLYAHLARIRVRSGQEVAVDQRLGTAGCTGWCTGTHLHFELRFHGRPVTPFRLTVLGRAS